MKEKAIKIRRPVPASRWLAIACMMLVLAATAAQVVHVHPLSDDANQCRICPVLHSVVPMVVYAAHLEVTYKVTATLVVFTKPHRQSWLEIPLLFSRPPPIA
jgi:hypothetical protein